jgi:hypothetical protein
MALDESIGMCDLCGKEADANFEVRPAAHSVLLPDQLQGCKT